MKVLTKAEEQVMQVLWKLEKGFLREIIDAMPAPKPHQSVQPVAVRTKRRFSFTFLSVNNWKSWNTTPSVRRR